jgi:hypothetical protein
MTQGQARVRAGGATRFIAFGAIAHFVSAPAFAAGAVSGTVSDEATGAPLAGAAVIATWSDQTGLENQNACVWVDVATTDSRGRYQIAAPAQGVFSGSLREHAATVSVYLAGRSCRVRDAKAGDSALAAQTCATSAGIPPDSRLIQLRSLLASATCIAAPRANQLKVLPVFRSAIDEMQALAPPDRRRATMFPICLLMLSTSHDDQALAGSVPTFPPGASPEDQAFLRREAPACVAILGPARVPIRQVQIPNPSSGGGMAPPVSAPK